MNRWSLPFSRRFKVSVFAIFDERSFNESFYVHFRLWQGLKDGKVTLWRMDAIKARKQWVPLPLGSECWKLNRKTHRKIEFDWLTKQPKILIWKVMENNDHLLQIMKWACILLNREMSESWLYRTNLSGGFTMLELLCIKPRHWDIGTNLRTKFKGLMNFTQFFRN